MVQVKCVIPGLKEKSITEMAEKLVRHIHRNLLRATQMADHRILSMVKKTRLTASSWMQNMLAKLAIKHHCERKIQMMCSQTLFVISQSSLDRPSQHRQ